MATDIGRVKWFNNKVGYGFITITDGQRSGTDVFVHHTAIVVENQQYKYLVQGEYVEFSLVQGLTQGLTHEYNATNVKGVKNCGLMCETKRNTSSNSLAMPCNRQCGYYIKNDGSYTDNLTMPCNRPCGYYKDNSSRRPPRIIIPSTDSNRITSFREPRYRDLTNTPKQTNLRENI